MSQRITFIGAGAWGTALAMAACRLPGPRVVRLHVRDAQQAASICSERVNARYLPGVSMPQALQVLGGPLAEVITDAQPDDLFIVATPMAGLRQTVTTLGGVPA